jgi:predicted alpha-1,6-mannanase (GH76 family)
MKSVTFALLAAAAAGAAAAAAASAAPFNATAGARAAVLADRLLVCNWVPALGSFDFEGLWQSGNTLETLAYFCASGAGQREPGLCSRVRAAFAAAFAKLPVIVDQCFDDHQWFGLAFVRGYELTGEVSYLSRAAAIWNFTATNGWSLVPCGGGVDWCPNANPYKNAITIELFLALTMDLHAHAAAAGLDPSSLLAWAAKEWSWLRGSGMIGSSGLINDGLDGATCKNNGQTTWTYNQGTLLDALVALGAAGGDGSAPAAAAAVAAAAMSQLSPAGVLREPCSGACDGDQQLFKGIFVRHLLAAAAGGLANASGARAFVAANAASLLARAACAGGGYGLDWDAPCATQTVATFSSALDLLTAAAQTPAGDDAGGWLPAGLGACADAAGAAMPACVKANVDEPACAAAADALRAPAYDFEAGCLGATTCRVRTTAGAAACAPGWAHADGPATAATRADGASLTVCALRAA